MNPRRDSTSPKPVTRPVLLLAFCLCMSLLLPSPGRADELVLRNGHDQPVFSHPVADGDTFAITYTHSVAQTPVTDYFTIKKHEIWLDRTVYHDFGAGLPHSPEKGQKMTHANGQLIISGYNRRLPDFELRVGRVANHQLIIFAGKSAGKKPEKLATISLSTLTSPGQTLKFAVESDPVSSSN